MTEQKHFIKKQPGKSFLTVKTLAFSGVFAALIALSTMLNIPTGTGYVNLGDGVILACAYLLGPIAFFPAAIGSALADLLLGYPLYIPGTFIIKGCMGLFAGWMLKKEELPFLKPLFKNKAKGFSFFFVCLFSYIVSELFMVSGYFLYSSLFLKGWLNALGSVVSNLGQGVAGVLLAFLLQPVVSKIKKI